MTAERIEEFWENATSDDVAKIANTRKSTVARFRDEENEGWVDYPLVGWKLSKHLPGARWIDADGAMWNHCQVYREPSWHANKPDPGLGWRLLGKFPDEELKPGDDAWDVWNDNQWRMSDSANGGMPQGRGIWYRRRIEAVEPKFTVGQTVRVVGPKERPALHWGKEMDRHIGFAGVIQNIPLYEDGKRFYNLEGIGIWCFREDYLEPVEPEPKHYVLRVGDSFETPSGHLIKAVSPGVEQIEFKLRAGFKATLPNGQTITATEKGFEVKE